MIDIKLFNTLSGKKEKFYPLDESAVKIYNCGPTVYDRQHIGNMRSVVIWDVLRRTLQFFGYKVEQVVNITDFGHLTSDADLGEDKMVKGLKRENLPLTLEAMKTLADKYATIYFEDRKKINALDPNHSPFASDFIKEDIELIKKLEDKGFTYATSDGIYFDTSKFADYGKLGGLSEKGETRVGVNLEKKNYRDFTLWKFNREIGWDSPWGKGFPGWHIECSAIVLKHFTDFFSNFISENQQRILNQHKSALIDIHTGGIEHIPIHHNNEIAQSESATGRPFARFWLHNEHLIMKSGEEKTKMAKSLGNVITLKEIEDKTLNPISLRMFFLQAHYRSPIMFSWEALEASDNALSKIKSFLREISDKKGKSLPEYIEKFKEIISDDMDTPGALALLWKVLKDEGQEKQDRKATILEFDKVLGLNLSNVRRKNDQPIPAELKKLVNLRETARRLKDWKKSDELREQIEKMGFKIKDTENGPEVKTLNDEIQKSY